MKRTRLFSVALLAAAWLAGGSAQAWDEPAKDADGVYQIGTASELEWFAGYVNSVTGNDDPDCYRPYKRSSGKRLSYPYDKLMVHGRAPAFIPGDNRGICGKDLYGVKEQTQVFYR